jgi:hypothetical protein
MCVCARVCLCFVCARVRLVFIKLFQHRGKNHNKTDKFRIGPEYSRNTDSFKQLAAITFFAQEHRNV